MVFWLYPLKRWNCGPILLNIGILTSTFEILKFWSFPFKHLNSGLILPKFFPILQNSEILTLSFQTLEFSPTLSNTAILKHSNSGLILPNLECWPYFSKHRSKHLKSDRIQRNIEILALFFQTLELFSLPSKRWNSDGIFQTWEYWPNPSKDWNSDLILSNTGIRTLSF